MNVTTRTKTAGFIAGVIVSWALLAAYYARRHCRPRPTTHGRGRLGPGYHTQALVIGRAENDELNRYTVGESHRRIWYNADFPSSSIWPLMKLRATKQGWEEKNE